MCPSACMIFILVTLGKSFSYSVSDWLLVFHTNFTELHNNFIFSEGVKWTGVLSTIPCYSTKMRDVHLHSPPPTRHQGFPSPRPCSQQKSKVWAAWLPGCHGLGSDKNNRSSGLTKTHAHPCYCPSLGRWNSLAYGMQGYFRLRYARLHELLYTPLFPLKFDLLALCTWDIFVSLISACQL